MSRKTYSFETFNNIHKGLLAKGIERVGFKVLHRPDVIDKIYDEITRTRIIMIHNKITNKVTTFCPLDNHTFVEITESEADLLLAAYEDCHWQPYCKPRDYVNFTDFERQEVDKLYKSLSGHEPDDSYEWILYPYSFLPGGGSGINYTDYKFSM